MMKKFVLILALVSLVATAAFAGDVNFKFSGKVTRGYDFKFGTPNSFTSITDRPTFDGDEFKVEMTITDPDDIWTLSGVGTPWAKPNAVANATLGVHFSKALEAEGVDMGDWTIDFTIGNGSDKNLNAYRTGIETTGKMLSTATIGYGKYAKVKFAADPSVSPKTGVVSALVTPIDGLKFGVGYGRSSNIWIDKKTKYAHTNILVADATADIAKFIGTEDFTLTASLADFYGLKDDSNPASKNFFFANVSGGIKEVDGKVDFTILNKAIGLGTEINLHLVEGLGLSAAVNFHDMDDSTKFAWDINPDISYAFSGVKCGLKAKFASDKSWEIKPEITYEFSGAKCALKAKFANDKTWNIDPSISYSLGGVDYSLVASLKNDKTFTVTPTVAIAF